MRIQRRSKTASPDETAAARADYDAYAESGIRLRLFEEALRFFPTTSLIDLGAGHCKFTLLAHSKGWRATALDARTERRPDLPSGVDHIHANVDSDAWTPADYDVIVCLGLYYHLSQDAQHGLLRRIAGRPLILDTHWATSDGSGWFTRAGQLTSITSTGGEDGAYFAEAPGLTVEQRKATSLLASIENDRSFWATLPSLQATLRSFGYATQWVASHPYEGAQRSFIVALP